MNRRSVVLLIGTLLVGAAALAVPQLLSGGGGLQWSGAPQLYRVPGVASDRILSGQVVNTSDRAIYVDAREMAVVDTSGHRLETAARFLSTFAHPLYAPTQFHTFGGAFQLQRLGVAVRIEPGQRMPLTVSWRESSGAASPASLEFADGSLAIPAA